MPLFYQHTINEYTRLGVWQIEEAEVFFTGKVPLKRDVSHPHKRLQHLAGRFLLPALFPDFPLEEIVIADTRKPFLENEKYHFSISHCGNFAAAIVSSRDRVGVDIELITPKIERIRHKFLEEKEYHLAKMNWPLPTNKTTDASAIDQSLQTLLWSAKESIYKWFGEGLVDFRQHMQLIQPLFTDDQDWINAQFVFQKYDKVNLTVKSRFFDDLVLAYVVS